MLAIGKAAGVMAGSALEELRSMYADSFPDRFGDALVIVPQRTEAPTTFDTRVLHAAHPYPDASSEYAAAAAEALLDNADTGDVVLVLVSGGASALCAAPVAGIGIDEYAAVVRMLMHAGADIRELNTVRTQIDRLKGGGMGRLAAPARALGLLVSDVVGNPLDIIASGPLTPGTTTAGDALRILHAFELLARVPAAVRNALQKARDVTGRDRTEKRSVDAPIGASSIEELPHVRTQIILDNRTAVDGAAVEARRLGYDARIVVEPLNGSARDAGLRIATDAVARADALHATERPVCVIYGGETTVEVTGTGSGGRNLELVLAAATTLDGDARVTAASVGTDGIDGSSDAAGAVADGDTGAAGMRAGVSAGDALHNNDSHAFFAAAGGLIHTGATGTNVMDVAIALVDSACRLIEMEGRTHT